MTGLRISTPSRLHFGLLGWGEHALRQYGGVGLMIDQPGLSLSATIADRISARGPLAARAIEVAQQVTRKLAEQGVDAPPLEIIIERAPRPHVGLGSGTQLALAVARLVAEIAGCKSAPASTLARWSGRGLRSGIGLHGFDLGGLLVDGGRRGDDVDRIPPLLARVEFPANWSILVVVPSGTSGLHGPDEIAAFGRLPAVAEATTDRLCKLVLLGLLPTVLERDLAGFGAALCEIQRQVGSHFAPAQGGGIFASRESTTIAAWLESAGLYGVGQSSWGPAIYGFSSESIEKRLALLDALRDHFSIPATDAFWTTACRQGAKLESWDRP